MSKPDCIFCRIIAGDAPAHRVYEDDRLLVFMDLFPVGRGHLLIIPKRHGENIFEVDEVDLLATIALSKKIAEAQRTALEPDGIGVHQLNGAAAGQTVFHYHMHLIPRNHGDPQSLHGRIQGDDADLEKVAGLVRDALEAQGD